MQGTLEKTETREWVVVNNEGVSLFGILHRPTLTENPPVVMILHGFASSKHGSNRCYVTLAETLAKEGIAALRFDFRGSGDSEGSLAAASFDDLISDATAVSSHLLQNKGIDASRLGVFGASLGGAIGVQFAALSGAAKALALWAPVASGELWFRDFLMRHPEMMNGDPKAALGSYRGINLTPEFRDQFARLCADKSVGQLPHLPLLHMHGEGDDVISISHQEAYRKSAGPNARFISYSDEQHSLGFAKAFPEVVGETVAFFREHLA